MSKPMEDAHDKLHTDQGMATLDLCREVGIRMFGVGIDERTSSDAPETYFVHGHSEEDNCVYVAGYADVETALDGFCAEIIIGGRCRCGKFAVVRGLDCKEKLYEEIMMVVDDSIRTPADVARIGTCEWFRDGPIWVSVCGVNREVAN